MERRRGSTRIGIEQRSLVLIEQNRYGLNYNYITENGDSVVLYDYSSDSIKYRLRGDKRYELSNHLGNVLAVITDRRIQSCGMGEVMFYSAQVVSVSDYYPFGQEIHERTYSGVFYRFGFNGHESDEEIDGQKSFLNFGARIYNTCLGRFVSTDPLESTYSWQSPYAYFKNCSISTIDFRGMGGVDDIGRIESKKIEFGSTPGEMAIQNNMSLKEFAQLNPTLYSGKDFSYEELWNSKNWRFMAGEYALTSKGPNVRLPDALIYNDRGEVVGQAILDVDYILNVPVLTIVNLISSAGYQAKNWQDLQNLFESGKFKVVFNGTERTWKLGYYGGIAGESTGMIPGTQFVKDAKVKFAIRAASYSWAGKTLSGVSKLSGILGYVVVAYDFAFDPNYGKGFGDKNGRYIELGADLTMTGVGFDFPWGTAASLHYFYRIKPVLKAETQHERYDAVGGSSGYRNITCDCESCTKARANKRNPNVGGYSDGFGRSDSTLKKNIIRLDSISPKLKNINVYIYDWKDTSYSNFSEIGVLAQEVITQFPELVRQDSNGTYWVSYKQLIAVLLQGYKEQEIRIEELEEQVEKLSKAVELILKSDDDDTPSDE